MQILSNNELSIENPFSINFSKQPSIVFKDTFDTLIADNQFVNDK
jgi:hypothetical protein